MTNTLAVVIPVMIGLVLITVVVVLGILYYKKRLPTTGSTAKRG